MNSRSHEHCIEDKVTRNGVDSQTLLWWLDADWFTICWCIHHPQDAPYPS